MKTFKKILLGLLLLVSTVGNAQWYGLGNYTLINQSAGGGEGWNISTAIFNQGFNVSAIETTPYSFAFKPDGLKLYVYGQATDKVNEYDLSVAWDVSTAVYLQQTNANFNSFGGDGYSISFKPDGTRMFFLNFSNLAVEYYDLSTAWDITTIGSINNWTEPHASVVSLKFNSDGTKMYILSLTGSKIYEHDLSTAWLPSSATFNQDITISEDSSIWSVEFKPDGIKMYVLGNTNDSLYEYDLSVAFDISTYLYLQTLGVNTFPTSIRFKPDGTKMYILDASTATINEYDLTD